MAAHRWHRPSALIAIAALLVALALAGCCTGRGPCGRSPALTPELLVGDWFCWLQADGAHFTFAADGTFVMTFDVEPDVSGWQSLQVKGRWALRDGRLSWVYREPREKKSPRPPPAEARQPPTGTRLLPPEWEEGAEVIEDDPIVESSPDRFVLRESDGSHSVWLRVGDRKHRPPDRVYERDGWVLDLYFRGRGGGRGRGSHGVLWHNGELVVPSGPKLDTPLGTLWYDGAERKIRYPEEISGWCPEPDRDEWFRQEQRRRDHEHR